MAPPGPPPKKSKTGLIVGLVVGGLALVLLCACGGVGAWHFISSNDSNSSGPSEPRFNGDYAVEDNLCGTFQFPEYQSVAGEFEIDTSSQSDLTEHSAAVLQCIYEANDTHPRHPLLITTYVHSNASLAEDDYSQLKELNENDDEVTVDPETVIGEDSYWHSYGSDAVSPANVYLDVLDDNLQISLSILTSGDFTLDVSQAVLHDAADEVMTALAEDGT